MSDIKGELSSRERLLRCIRHEAIDRVPISTYELVGWNDNAWENNEASYRRLMEAIRKHTDCIYMFKAFADDGSNTSEGITTWVEGNSEYTRKILSTGKGDLTALYRKDKNVHTTWTLKHMLDDIDDIDKFLSIPYRPRIFDMDLFKREQAKLGDRGLMMISLHDPIADAAELFEMGNFLVHAITEPGKIKYFLDAIHERQLQELRELLKHDVQNVIFRICGPEYAAPPYLSPEYYYDYVTVYLIRMCREIRDAGGIPRIHCHGRIGRVLEQFAQTCAEGLDPVEPPPDGDISLAEVKRLYGKQFCLFGNIELKELEMSDTGRIDQLVKKAMEDAKEGSGFVLMPTAAPINVPLSPITERNYLQMIESALKYGQY